MLETKCGACHTEPKLPFFNIDLKNFENNYLSTVINYIKSCDLRQNIIHYQIGFKQVANNAYQFRDYQFAIQGKRPLFGVLVLKYQTISIGKFDSVTTISHKIIQHYLYWLKQRLLVLRQVINAYDSKAVVCVQADLQHFYQALGVNIDTMLEDNYNSRIWSIQDEYYFVVRHLERTFSGLYMYHLIGLDNPKYAKLFNELIIAKYGLKGYITDKAHNIIVNQLICEPDNIKQLFFNSYLKQHNFTKEELFL